MWLVDDLALEQRVALKLISRYGDAANLQRTRREVRLGRDLEHPNLVRVFDLVDTPHHMIVVMEWVPGGSLKEYAADRKLPVDWVVGVAEQVLDVLACLHGRGIVHRDVKPSNLLLTADGSVKLADLGLARPLEGGADLTRTGDTVGTPHYMSPEQLYGKPPAPASDLYGLGVTLYELLAGERPFSGASDFAVADGHLRGAPPALRTRRSDCPRWLAAFVHRLLEKRPEDRWPDAAAARATLGRRRVRSLRLWRRAAAAAVVVALAGASSWLAAAWRHPALDSVKMVDGHTVAAVAADGRELWRRAVGGHVASLRVADLTGDSAPEAVLFLRDDAVTDGFSGCSVVVLSATGDEVARIDPGVFALEQTYPEMSRRYRPGPLEVGDLDGDGRPELLAAALHRDWYPAALAVWWGHRDGRTQVLLVNSGRIDDVATADLDGDGNREIVVTGVNNPLGYQTIVAVLRSHEPSARSPDLREIRKEPRKFATYVPLGPERTPARFGAVGEGGIELRTGGGVLALDRWGIPTATQGRITAAESTRFWSDLDELCRSVAVDHGHRRQLVERFNGDYAPLLAEPPWRLAATLMSTRALANAGDHELAITELEEATAAHPEQRDLWLRLGEQLLISGRREAGRAALIRSLQSDAPGRLPFDNVMLLTLDAALNVDGGAWNEAMSLWDSAVQRWQILNAEALPPLRPFFSGQWDDAAFDSLRPNWNLKATTVMAAWAHLERGDDPAQIENAARELAQDPEIADTAKLLEAAAALRSGELARARALAREALDHLRIRGRTSYEAFVWLPAAEWLYGSVLRADGHARQARPHLEHAAQLAPRSWFGRRAAAMIR